MCRLGWNRDTRSSGTLAHSQHLCMCIGPEIIRSRERYRQDYTVCNSCKDFHCSVLHMWLMMQNLY